MPVTLVPTPPRYFALPRMVIWLPVTGLRPHTSQDWAIQSLPLARGNWNLENHYCITDRHGRIFARGDEGYNGYGIAGSVVMQGGRGYNRKCMAHETFISVQWPMKSSPLFLAICHSLGADAKPKIAETDQPAGGAKAQQPAADQARPSRSRKPTPTGRRRKGRRRPAQTAQAGARPTSMAIIPEPGGLKTLTIHFRWSLFPNASVEVRLVPGPEPKGVTVTPIYFSEHLKGTVREALYACLDHPGEAAGPIASRKTRPSTR